MIRTIPPGMFGKVVLVQAYRELRWAFLGVVHFKSPLFSFK